MSATTQPTGVLTAFARFFVDPRASVRAVLDSRPSESRLLAFGMFAAFAVFVRQTTPIFRSDDVTDAQLAEFIEHLVASLFFLPLGFYLFAVLGTLIARALRGQGTWYEGRVAFFWALFLCAVVLIFAQILFGLFAGWLPPVVLILIWCTALVFCPWAMAQCYAEAFHFTRTWVVFLFTCSPMIVLYIAYARETLL